MKRILILAAVVAVSSIPAFSQQRAGNAEGGISLEMLEQISKGYTATPADRAIRNALAGTAINVLAVNSENAAMIDIHFSDRVRTKGITDQKSSGRCWLFTGLNVLRAKMIDKYNLGGMEFSQNYLFFYDQLEKCNLFLQGIVDTKELPEDDRTVDWLFSNPLSDGGQFTGVSNLVTKYGLVPSGVMPETFCSNNTSQMAMLLKLKLREDGLRLRKAWDKAAAASAKLSKKAREAALAKASSELQGMKVEMLSEIYHFLVLCLGEPPVKFTWDMYDKDDNLVSSKEYTPKSFYAEYLGEDLEDNYIMVMNDPCREYGKVYEIEYDRHVYDGHNWLYVNLPIERIKEMAIASIKDNTAMYFSCDVGKFFDRTKGTLDLANYDYSSLSGFTFGMDKKERVQTHASGSSHAMTLIAVDVDKETGLAKKWMVENSWGPSAGYKGCLIMTDEWFNEYMFRLVLEKKYVPQDILDMLNQEPVALPAWDPMFMPEE
ncbi:MAG: C1 family peptidase [Clostridium sp.]|nr:C1 family peptidase [Bacteroides sp.]MCM1199304.1 C1 family peptidase [Clostridium sp.]